MVFAAQQQIRIEGFSRRMYVERDYLHSIVGIKRDGFRVLIGEGRTEGG